jgi:hypothetical protein
MLMMDGSIMVQVYSSQTGEWYRLTPDAFGSYLNGTWTSDSHLPAGYAPLYYCSAVLPDNRLVVIGGEYNYEPNATTGVYSYVVHETTKGAIYDPKTHTWANLPPPSGVSRIGDSMCSVLTNGPNAGKLALGPNANSNMYVLDPTTLTWTALGPTGKADGNSEEGWTLLLDGTIFVVNANTGMGAQRYFPSLNQWKSMTASPVPLRDSSSHETGAQVLMYNGSVFNVGADRNTGSNAVFIPPAVASPPDASTGSWLVAPPFPRKPYATAAPSTNCTGTAPNLQCQLDQADGPGAALINGRVLFNGGPGVFNNDTYFFEYDPATNTVTEVARPTNANTQVQYAYHFLTFPDGNVFAPTGSASVFVYTPDGGPIDEWRPVITNVPKTLAGGSSYSLTGQQLNGLTEGSYYGDDYESATNYPIIRITNHATGHVFWANAHDRDNLNITPGVVVTTQFDVPSGMETGTSDLVVIANGIASAGVEVNHPPVTTATLTGTKGLNGWWVTSVQVKLTATSPDGATIAATNYTIDGGATQAYSGPFTVSGDGIHTITFWSVDSAGNTEAANPQTIKIDTTRPAISAGASITRIWPPNGQTIADVFSGNAADLTAGLDLASATFRVTDSEGAVQPTGSVTINDDGTFSFTLQLIASRLGTSKDGRTYTIVVSIADLAGNTASATVLVVVPHDQGGGDGGR